MEQITINFYKSLSCATIVDNQSGTILPSVAFLKPGVYRHYKGKFYTVFFVALHSETLQDMVVYQALYNDFRLWSRPLTMFTEDIEYQGVLQPRFVWVDECVNAEQYR